ncbi:MAG: OsmC family protein [Thermodesulfovibrionales bacterium]
MADETESLEQSLGDYKGKVSPVNKLTLELDKDLIFTARTQRGYEIDFDAKVEWGCMPTESLLASVAGCLAIDIVSFLRKMRAEISDFRMEVTGERNPVPPQYYKAVDLMIRIRGRGITENKMERAINLSKEKYCSVYHTLRPDLRHEVRYEIISED